VLKIVLADKSAPIHHTVWGDVVDKFLEFTRTFPAEGRVVISMDHVTAKKEVDNTHTAMLRALYAGCIPQVRQSIGS